MADMNPLDSSGAEWEERFEKLFFAAETLPDPVDQEQTDEYVHDREEIKNFIRTEKEKSRQEALQEVEKILEDMKTYSFDTFAISQALSKLQELMK